MISGFSKLSKAEKLDWLAKQTGVDLQLLDKLCFTDSALQQTIDEISENVVSNFVLPYSLAPNFVINGVEYAVPMVIEESSVVAAASSAAKFWASHGGFQARVISTGKIGQIHFLWKGEFSDLQSIEYELNMRLLKTTDSLLEKMKGRGGGITKIEWLDFSSQMLNYYQIRLTFETVDAMGANIINSCLEAMAQGLKEYLFDKFPENDECEIVMAILSNHTPDCLVECSVSCPIDALAEVSGDMAACDFARKFETAVRIAQIDPYRAATHNKGIFNGVDAVAMATGNDYRAIEAGGHAFAASSGSYKALTYCEISNSIFTYTLRMPMALGTVGGLTVVHPLAALSLRILQNPSAVQLMQIAASVGLANNFLAIKALITKGIQCGHMRFQLSNILKSLNISDEQAAKVVVYFKDKTVSYRAVEEFLGN